MDQSRRSTTAIKLAEEKRAILLQQQEVKALEIRLEAINKENADIERNLAANPLVPQLRSSSSHQQPAATNPKWRRPGINNPHTAPNCG